MKNYVVLLLLLVSLVGCSHQRVSVAVPAAPPAHAQPSDSDSGSASESRSAGPQTNSEQPQFPLDAKPLWSETGIASWYGAPYHNRRASNGEVYDMHAMTAAHRTLPLGTIVRVTDIKTGSSAMVRITDRGIVQRGTAEVRVDVLKTPSAVVAGGRWAVQIGTIEREQAARELAARLSRRYRTANVLTFNSPVGDWWVRIRVKGDLKARAEEVLHDTSTSEGAIFLVRLD
jgi:rare lipoprotein A